MTTRWKMLCILMFFAIVGFGCDESPITEWQLTDGDKNEVESGDGDKGENDEAVPDGDGESACSNLCDCPQGWFCNVNHQCEDGTGLIGTPFCCDNSGCPSGAPCEFRDGRYSTCPVISDGDTEQEFPTDGDTEIEMSDGDAEQETPDGDAEQENEQDLPTECRYAEDCPPCHNCLEIDGTKTCVGIGDYQCMNNADCTLESYCKPFQATHPECGGDCEPLYVARYTLHEWGVNQVHLGGGSDVSSGPPKYWGAIPAKPVIYIYAEQPMTLDVGVHFSSGKTTETWPIEENGATVYWKDISVTQGSCSLTPTPQPDSGAMEVEDKEIYQLSDWIIPEADCLNVGDVNSRLLFYTGELTSYQPLLEANYDIDTAQDEVVFTLTNKGQNTLGPVLLLYRSTEGQCVDPSFCPVNKADIAWKKLETLPYGAQTPVIHRAKLHHLTSNNQNQSVQIPQGWSDQNTNLETMLENSGLTDKEIDVFMKAWKDVFFGLYAGDEGFIQPGYENGAFAIYLWPGEHAEATLPLLLDPKPTDLKRAIVEYQPIPPTSSEGVVTGTVTIEEYDGMSSNPIWTGPAGGAKVTAWQNSEKKAEATTDNDGLFLLQVAPGVYTITAERNAWETGDRKENLAVMANQLVYVDLTLSSETMVDKPNLYLYPTQTQEIEVKLGLCYTCKVTQSIPDYGQGWRVTVSPEGLIDGQYGYLFYEAEIPHRFPLLEGWSIPAEDVSVFFGQLLHAYGLNAKETADFVDFWSTHLPPAAYYAVYPLVTANVLDPLVRLAIQPAPDSLFRLWFVISPEASELSLAAPTVVPMSRVGFAAVEWGVILD